MIFGKKEKNQNFFFFSIQCLYPYEICRELNFLQHIKRVSFRICISNALNDKINCQSRNYFEQDKKLILGINQNNPFHPILSEECTRQAPYMYFSVIQLLLLFLF